MPKTIVLDFPRREGLAWAAGFFDGEGNARFATRTTANGTTHRAVIAQVSQIEPGPLNRLVESLGIGRVRGPYVNSHGGEYVWSVQRFETVQYVAASLWPWLGDVKRKQFRSSLTTYLTFQSVIALCEHGSPRQQCRPCRSAWMTRSWSERKARA